MTEEVNSTEPTLVDWNLWTAQILIEELFRLGISQAVIAPGSRSAPLSLAIAQHRKMKWLTHFDERGAGFLALGLAKALEQPVTVVTTSGSAVANLLPAVVEAYQSRIPLILLTADRPEELIDCGANQAIRQPGIFGHFAVKSLVLNAPDAKIDLRKLLIGLDSLLSTQSYGPIHINCPYREPFYPGSLVAAEGAESQPLPALTDCPGLPDSWLSSGKPFFSATKAALHQLPAEISKEWQTLTDRKGIIVAGQLSPEQGGLVVALARKLDWPVLADLGSHCRGETSATHCASHYGFWLGSGKARNCLQQAELVLQVGERLTDKALQQWIGRQAPEAHWLISEGIHKPDPDNRVSRWLNFAITPVLSNLAEKAVGLKDRWWQPLIDMDRQTGTLLNEYFEAETEIQELAVCGTLQKMLPVGGQCLISNSLPIRLMDLIVGRECGTWRSQRGASGIDGNLAHAAGLHVGGKQTTTLIIGDLAFLHDLNSLALCQPMNRRNSELENTLPNNGNPLIIIVINNDGGNIFSMLPVPEQHRTALFRTPHGFRFRKFVEGFGIDYHCPGNLEEFSQIYLSALQQKSITVVELLVPSNEVVEQLNLLKKLCIEAIDC